MSNPYSSWFKEFNKTEEFKKLIRHPVAYFCAEYALEPGLPTYAGGLGVLSGDYVREAAKNNFPLIAVGLFYKRSRTIADARIDRAKIKKALDKDGKEAEVVFPLETRLIYIRAWEWEEGGARVYLLDTDLKENDPIDRDITRELYDDNRDLRLKQEIILGLGGFRMLARLGYHASVYHLNESHSAFIALELVRHEMEHQRVDFGDAFEFAKKHIVFTNHTLLQAGQELFAEDRVSLFMSQYAEEMGLTGKDISSLGESKEMPNLLSMTNLAFNLTHKSNAVSKLHSIKASSLWPDQKMESITNGIFLPRWDRLGDKFSRNITEGHAQNKRKLIALVREKTGVQFGEQDLILAWARRLVEYKQPTLILDHIDKLEQIIKNSPVPVRLVFSGPTGSESNPYVDKIKKIIRERLSGNVVFLPNYSTEIAEVLTAGADVWLNTPLVGFEACGTSGMKAGLNGTLSLSTNDGWIYEVRPEEVGWVVNDPEGGKEMLDVLQSKIIPAYVEYQAMGEKSLWSERMRRLRALIIDRFSTTRMLKEYIEKLYLPTLAQKHEHRVD